MLAGQPFILSPEEESQMEKLWKTKEPFQVVTFDGIDCDDWKFLESMGLNNILSGIEFV